MLLSLMRKHAKSWIIKFLIGIIAVVFIFYFGYSFTSNKGFKIAYVNGESISGLEYQKAYRQRLSTLRRDYKNFWNDQLIEAFDLKNITLQNLINQKLISQEARMIGLDITEKEIQDEILASPAFQFKGRFDETRYRALLSQNRMKPEDFEASIAQDMLQTKLKQFIMTFLSVTNQEIVDQYTFSNEKVKISFVKFLPETFKGSVKGDQTSMMEYFNEHKEGYRIPDKIKIAYILFDPKKFEDQVTITDQHLNDYYEDNLEMFKQQHQVNARHILFKLDEDATKEEEEKVKEKALAVLEKARKGEDFATLATKHSEGPSAKQGGDLGYFSKGQMVKPFEEVVFKMKKGEISDLARTPFGYHIIKVEDVKEEKAETLEKVRGQIAKSLTQIASMDLAHEKALSLIDQMPYEVDLSQYATSHGVSVKQSDYFSISEPMPELGDGKLLQSIFSLQKNDVSELLEFGEKFYIVQVVDKKSSYLPESNEVSEKLTENFKSHLATLEAESEAEKYLAKLKEGKSWGDLAKENILTSVTTDFFNRTDFIPQIGYDPDLQEAAFSLDENKRYSDRVFKNENGVFVIRWEDQKGIDEKKYQEEKEKYQYSLMQAKHQSIFGAWLENLRKNAEVEIVQPVSSL